MLTEAQIKQFREALMSAENPLFFYDDDPDGVCSYLILKKFVGHGHGIIKKSSPELTQDFARKVDELNPDKVFILDTPIVSQEFIDKVKKPIYWLDHHPLVSRNKINYFNPLQNSDSSEPTSALSYQITNNLVWLAVVGSIADWHYPEFMPEFNKLYPDLIDPKLKDPEEILFNSKLSKVIQLISLLLKASTSEIRKSLSVLEKIESPLEIINESTTKARYLIRKVKSQKEAYGELLEKALKQKQKNGVLFFPYKAPKWSFTRELATELNHRIKSRVLIVARLNQGLYKMSLRSKEINLQEITPKLIEGLQGYGGGHKFAVGVTIQEKDIDEFLNRLKKLIK